MQKKRGSREGQLKSATAGVPELASEYFEASFSSDRSSKEVLVCFFLDLHTLLDQQR